MPFNYPENLYAKGLWVGELEQAEINEWFDLLLNLEVLPPTSQWNGLKLADISANRGTLLVGIAQDMQTKLKQDGIRLTKPVELIFSDKYYQVSRGFPSVKEDSPLLSGLQKTIVDSNIDTDQFSIDVQPHAFGDMHRHLLDGCDLIFDRLGEAWYNKVNPYWYLFRASRSLRQGGWLVFDGQPYRVPNKTMTPSTYEVTMARFPDFLDLADGFSLKVYQLEHPYDPEYPILAGLRKEGRTA